MMKNTSWLSRLFSLAALALFLMAAIDWIMRLFGYTLSFLEYQPGRLFEFAAIMMIFVIALVLRQIRDRLGKS